MLLGYLWATEILLGLGGRSFNPSKEFLCSGVGCMKTGLIGLHDIVLTGIGSVDTSTVTLSAIS